MTAVAALATTARPLVAKPQAQDLFAQGYRCQVTLDGNLLVTNPAGKRYLVTKQGHTCTCIAGQHHQICKHVRAMKSLALAQCTELWNEGCDWQIAAVADGHNEGMWQRGQALVHEASEMYAWATAEEAARL